MKKKLMAALAAGALAVIPASAAMATSHGLPDIVVATVDVPTSDEAAEVVVVHGVPGLDVDIYANGDLALEGFQYTDTQILPLPAGTYELEVYAAGADADDADPALSLTADVDAGVSYTVAAFLDADGNPTIDAFANLTDATGIQAFHLAAFGAVDVYAAGGEVTALPDVTNGVTARIDVDGGDTVEGVGIGVAGSGEIAIDLEDVTVPEDTLVLVYAVGPVPVEEAPEEEAEEAEEEVEQPEAVHSGTGGLLDAGLPVWVAALMVMGALGIAAPAVATARRRS